MFGFGLIGKQEADEDDINLFTDLDGEGDENFKRFDVGLNAGVNFNFRSFQLGTQFTWSFPEFYEAVPDSKNRVFTANFAYFF